jgi:hypothetical protein
MWTPVELFYIMLHCSLSPCESARLNVVQIIEQQENKIINESVGLRDGI